MATLFRRFEKDKIERFYKSFCKTQIADYSRFSLTSIEIELRELMLKAYRENIDYIETDKYAFDVAMGLTLYRFITSHSESLLPMIETDYNFWRTLSTVIFPEVTQARWGLNSIEHFYNGSSHIYANQIYWYIKLSWQGNESDTYEIIKNNTTDEILNLVDRTGKSGLNIDLYRLIMKKYSTYAKNQRTIKRNNKSISIFRLALVKHTMKSAVVVPEIYGDGLQSYVDMLFEI